MVTANQPAVATSTLQVKVTVNDESVDFVLDLTTGEDSGIKEIPSGDKVYLNYHSYTPHSPRIPNNGEIRLRNMKGDEIYLGFQLIDGECVKEKAFHLRTFAVEHINRPPLRIKVEARLVEDSSREERE